MTDIFELLADEICENCMAATEDCDRGCGSGDYRCRFCMELEDLEKRCEVVTAFARDILQEAQNYSEYADYLAYLNI